MIDDPKIHHLFWLAMEKGNHEDARELAEKEPWLLLTRDESNRTPLHYVALNDGDEAMARWLVERGVDKDSTDEMGLTTLHYLGDSGEDAIDTAKALLDLGANPNIAGEQGESPLLLAALEGPGPNRYTDLLLERGAKPDIYSAVVLGQDQALRALLRNNPKLPQESPFRTRLVHDALISDIPNTELIVKILLECGVDPNERPPHAFPLLVMADALGENGLPIVRMLIEYGADVNAKDDNGQSVLQHFQIYGMNAATIALLVDAGAKESDA